MDSETPKIKKNRDGFRRTETIKGIRIKRIKRMRIEMKNKTYKKL
jgi:hypothetical protein